MAKTLLKLFQQLLKSEEVPSVVFNLTSTIRNNIFNYKETVDAIDSNDTDSYGTGINECECHNSPFIDSNHDHIVTGDLRIIQNQKLRQLLAKGPNFREPKTINWKKCREEITTGLSTCASNMIAKHKNLTVEHMNFWISRSVGTNYTSKS